MRFRSWLALGWAVGGACGGSALPVEGETCGPNGECASGLVCDPITDTCVPRGSNLAVSITSPSNGAGCTNQQVAFDTVTPGEPVRFECSLDGVPFSPCTPGITLVDLEAGPHTVRVRATDDAGNVGAETSVTFTVDPTPLSLQVDSVTPGAMNTGTASIAYSTNKLPARVAAGALLVDPAAQNPRLAPSCTCAAGSCACSQLPAGPISLGVRADDACGGSVLDAGSVTAAYGPYDGHAVLIGHDIGDAAVPGALLTNAVTLAPYLRDPGVTRPVRVLAFRGGLAADDPGRTRALELLDAISGFDAADATQYQEITSASQIDALAGRDVFLVYDQRDALGVDELVSAGTQWGPVLGPFLAAGGVVVVLSGTDGAGGPSPTYLVLGGQTPIMPIGDVTGGGGDVQATYPDALGTNYWLTRTVGATYTAAASSCFNDAQSGPGKPTVVYQEVDTSSVCPVVVDKLFGTYLVSASPNGIPVTVSATTFMYTGPGGTGSVSLEPSSVPRAGYSCYLFSNSQPANRTPCSITPQGVWSFSGLSDGGWTAVITLLDARGEPARASITQHWVVDAATDTSILQPAAGAARVTYFLGSEPTFYQGVTCSLSYLDGQRNPVLLTSRQGLGCGATLVPGTNLFNGGYHEVNWSGSFPFSATYRMTLNATDGVGNVSPSVSADWDIIIIT